MVEVYHDIISREGVLGFDNVMLEESMSSIKRLRAASLHQPATRSTFSLTPYFHRANFVKHMAGAQVRKEARHASSSYISNWRKAQLLHDQTQYLVNHHWSLAEFKLPNCWVKSIPAQTPKGPYKENSGRSARVYSKYGSTVRSGGAGSTVSADFQ